MQKHLFMRFIVWQFIIPRKKSRSSRMRVSCRKGVFKNSQENPWILQNSQENTSVRVFFKNKVVGLRPATLLKQRLWHECFPDNFAQFLRRPFYRWHPGDCFWMLLVKLFPLQCRELHCVTLRKSSYSVQIRENTDQK